MSEKLKVHHLKRGAYVYVRQSTPYQVRNNLQSKERQYALEGQAQQLGFSKVVVIDEDLGRSGSGIQERPGFGRLLASVCQGLAGAVFALEASRLARNNRDWHHLVDLCALTETLLIDSDGIYDPRQLNDRLVLGLKGTMSEFELGLMRQRAREAFEQNDAATHYGKCRWDSSGPKRVELRRRPIAKYSRRSSACSGNFSN
jgi:DNA invertase Pin-like site-specific DNA recombinase